MRWAGIVVVAGCGFRPSLADDAHPPMLDGIVDGHLDAPPDLPLDAGTPIIYVQDASAHTPGASASTVTTTFTAAQTLGDFDIVALAWVGGALTVNVVDSAGDTFVPLGGTITNGGVGQAVFYATNVKGALANTNVFTASFGALVTAGTIRASEYAGIATSAPLDGSTSAVGTGLSASAGPVVTSHHHDLLYGCETSNASASGPGAGYTQRILFNGDLVEDREVFTTGSYDAAVVMASSTPWIMLVAAFDGVR